MTSKSGKNKKKLAHEAPPSGSLAGSVAESVGMQDLNAVVLFVLVPVVPPRGIKVTSVDSTTLQVCWERIPHFPSLEEYEVHYTPFGQGMHRFYQLELTSPSRLNWSRPVPHLLCPLAGKTAEGLGSLSSPIAIQTSNFSSKWDYL